MLMKLQKLQCVYKRKKIYEYFPWEADEAEVSLQQIQFINAIKRFEYFGL